MDPVLLLWLVAVALVLAGVAGLLLPVLPGAPVLLAGLVMAAWIEDFRYAGFGTIALLTVLCGLIFVVDFVAGSFGARRFGASPRAAAGAAIGALVGIFFGLPGILLGPMAGAVLGEISARRTWTEAGRAGVGATLGLVLGAAAKLGLAMTMIGVFVLVRFLG